MNTAQVPQATDCTCSGTRASRDLSKLGGHLNREGEGVFHKQALVQLRPELVCQGV